LVEKPNWSGVAKRRDADDLDPRQPAEPVDRLAECRLAIAEI